MTLNKSRARPPILIEIKNIEELEKVYMPFIKTGGIFIPGKNIKPLSSVIIVLKINMENIREDFTISGKVQWFSPEKASTIFGVGIAFDSNAANERLKEKIEKILSGREIKNNFTM